MLARAVTHTRARTHTHTHTQATARDIFFAKHSNERKERWVSGNFVYFRMNRIVDIYFVGGFGTVQWIDPTEYLSSKPDDIVLDHPSHTLQVRVCVCVCVLGVHTRMPLQRCSHLRMVCVCVCLCVCVCVCVASGSALGLPFS